jgi:hypothetical protein
MACLRPAGLTRCWRFGAAGEWGEWVGADAAQEGAQGGIPDGAAAKERVNFLTGFAVGGEREPECPGSRREHSDKSLEARPEADFSLQCDVIAVTPLS